MFVTNWISTTKIQKISEITNFFRHYFLSRTEVAYTFNNRYNNTPRTVLQLGNNEYLQITGWTLGNQPSFCMVHPLGIKSNGDTVYGVSIYVQMTSQELKSMQDSAK